MRNIMTEKVNKCHKTIYSNYSFIKHIRHKTQIAHFCSNVIEADR